MDVNTPKSPYTFKTYHHTYHHTSIRAYYRGAAAKRKETRPEWTAGAAPARSPNSNVTQFSNSFTATQVYCHSYPRVATRFHRAGEGGAASPEKRPWARRSQPGAAPSTSRRARGRSPSTTASASPTTSASRAASSDRSNPSHRFGISCGDRPYPL